MSLNFNTIAVSLQAKHAFLQPLVNKTRIKGNVLVYLQGDSEQPTHAFNNIPLGSTNGAYRYNKVDSLLKYVSLLCKLGPGKEFTISTVDLLSLDNHCLSGSAKAVPNKLTRFEGCTFESEKRIAKLATRGQYTMVENENLREVITAWCSQSSQRIVHKLDAALDTVSKHLQGKSEHTWGKEDDKARILLQSFATVCLWELAGNRRNHSCIISKHIPMLFVRAMQECLEDVESEFLTVEIISAFAGTTRKLCDTERLRLQLVKANIVEVVFRVLSNMLQSSAPSGTKLEFHSPISALIDSLTLLVTDPQGVHYFSKVCAKLVNCTQLVLRSALSVEKNLAEIQWNWYQGLVKQACLLVQYIDRFEGSWAWTRSQGFHHIIQLLMRSIKTSPTIAPLVLETMAKYSKVVGSLLVPHQLAFSVNLMQIDVANMMTAAGTSLLLQCCVENDYQQLAARVRQARRPSLQQRELPDEFVEQTQKNSLTHLGHVVTVSYYIIQGIYAQCKNETSKSLPVMLRHGFSKSLKLLHTEDDAELLSEPNMVWVTETEVHSMILFLMYVLEFVQQRNQKRLDKGEEVNRNSSKVKVNMEELRRNSCSREIVSDGCDRDKQNATRSEDTSFQNSTDTKLEQHNTGTGVESSTQGEHPKVIESEEQESRMIQNEKQICLYIEETVTQSLSLLFRLNPAVNSSVQRWKGTLKQHEQRSEEANNVKSNDMQHISALFKLDQLHSLVSRKAMCNSLSRILETGNAGITCVMAMSGVTPLVNYLLLPHVYQTSVLQLAIGVRIVCFSKLLTFTKTSALATCSAMSKAILYFGDSIHDRSCGCADSKTARMVLAELLISLWVLCTRPMFLKVFQDAGGINTIIRVSRAIFYRTSSQHKRTLAKTQHTKLEEEGNVQVVYETEEFGSLNDDVSTITSFSIQEFTTNIQTVEGLIALLRVVASVPAHQETLVSVQGIQLCIHVLSLASRTATRREQAKTSSWIVETSKRISNSATSLLWQLCTSPEGMKQCTTSLGGKETSGKIDRLGNAMKAICLCQWTAEVSKIRVAELLSAILNSQEQTSNMNRGSLCSTVFSVATKFIHSQSLQLRTRGATCVTRMRLGKEQFKAARTSNTSISNNLIDVLIKNATTIPLNTSEGNKNERLNQIACLLALLNLSRDPQIQVAVCKTGLEALLGFSNHASSGNVQKWLVARLLDLLASNPQNKTRIYCAELQSSIETQNDDDDEQDVCTVDPLQVDLSKPSVLLKPFAKRVQLDTQSQHRRRRSSVFLTSVDGSNHEATTTNNPFEILQSAQSVYEAKKAVDLIVSKRYRCTSHKKNTTKQFEPKKPPNKKNLRSNQVRRKRNLREPAKSLWWNPCNGIEQELSKYQAASPWSPPIVGLSQRHPEVKNNIEFGEAEQQSKEWKVTLKGDLDQYRTSFVFRTTEFDLFQPPAEYIKSVSERNRKQKSKTSFRCLAKFPQVRGSKLDLGIEVVSQGGFYLYASTNNRGKAEHISNVITWLEIAPPTTPTILEHLELSIDKFKIFPETQIESCWTCLPTCMYDTVRCELSVPRQAKLPRSSRSYKTGNGSIVVWSHDGDIEDDQMTFVILSPRLARESIEEQDEDDGAFKLAESVFQRRGIESEENSFWETPEHCAICFGADWQLCLGKQGFRKYLSQFSMQDVTATCTVLKEHYGILIQCFRFYSNLGEQQPFTLQQREFIRFLKDSGVYPLVSNGHCETSFHQVVSNTVDTLTPAMLRLNEDSAPYHFGRGMKSMMRFQFLECLVRIAIGIESEELTNLLNKSSSQTDTADGVSKEPQTTEVKSKQHRTRSSIGSRRSSQRNSFKRRTTVDDDQNANSCNDDEAMVMTLSTTIQFVFNKLLNPNLAHEVNLDPDDWRSFRMYNEEVDNVLRVKSKELRRLFESRSGASQDVSGGEAARWGALPRKRMSFTEWDKLLTDMGVYNSSFTKRDGAFCFCMSLTSYSNNVTDWKKNIAVTYTGFLEALCRLSDSMFLPTKEQMDLVGKDSIVEFYILMNNTRLCPSDFTQGHIQGGSFARLTSWFDEGEVSRDNGLKNKAEYRNYDECPLSEKIHSCIQLVFACQQLKKRKNNEAVLLADATIDFEQSNNPDVTGITVPPQQHQELQSQVVMEQVTFEERVAAMLHDVWRTNRGKDENGLYLPRVKFVDNQQVDIANTEFKDLPMFFKFENLLAAHAACESIREQWIQFQEFSDGGNRENFYAILRSENFVERASAEQHDSWVKRNKFSEWVTDEQRFPYHMLSEPEKNKDRMIVRAAVEVYVTRTSAESTDRFVQLLGGE